MTYGDSGGATAYASPPPASTGAAAPPPPRRIAPGDYDRSVYSAKDNLDSYQRDFSYKFHNGPWQASQGTGSPGMTPQQIQGQLSDPAAFHAALSSDPEYQKRLKAFQDAQYAHQQGYSQPEFQLAQAAALHAGNSATAVATDADTRHVVGAGQAARDTGQGNLSTAQGQNLTALTPFQQQDLASQTNARNQLAPAQAANVAAEAAAKAADASRTIQMTPGLVTGQGIQNAGAQAAIPGNVAAQQAGARATNATAAETEQQTKLLPAITQAQVGNAQFNRNLQQQQADAQTRLSDAQGTAVGTDALTQRRAAAEQDYKNNRSIFRSMWEGIVGRPANVGAASVPVPPLPSAAGNAAAGPAPTAAPIRKQLPDGRVIEQVGNLVYQIMPDGSRKMLQVTQ